MTSHRAWWPGVSPARVRGRIRTRVFKNMNAKAIGDAQTLGLSFVDEQNRSGDFYVRITALNRDHFEINVRLLDAIAAEGALKPIVAEAVQNYKDRAALYRELAESITKMSVLCEQSAEVMAKIVSD